MTITIYGAPRCKACEDLKNSLPVGSFVYINVDTIDLMTLPDDFFDQEKGNNKIPQIYIDGKYMGRSL